MNSLSVRSEREISSIRFMGLSRLDLLDRDYRMVGGNTSLNRLELSKVTEAANFISNKGGNKLAINNNIDTL